MLSKLEVCPLVIVVGDERQQQPLESSGGAVRRVTSMPPNHDFQAMAFRHRLTQQFRCVVAHYEAFLDHMRYWQPSQDLLTVL